MLYDSKYLQYAQALYEALKEDAFYIAMENSSDSDSMIRYYVYSMLEAEKYGELFISPEHQFGVSIWSKPLPPEKEAKRAQAKKDFILKEMGNKALKTYTEIVDFMSEKAEQALPADCWYLSIIGILPEYQGQGLGGKLITPILEKTDRMGIPTYLETFTPRNMSFYRRLGYKETESFLEPKTGSEYFIMHRGANGEDI